MTYILPHIANMPAYQAGEQLIGPKVLKLNSNENPFPPSKNVLEALHSIVYESFRYYPDNMCDELCEEIANQNQVMRENVFCGNGSSDIISLLFTVFIGTKGKIALPDPTFTLYEHVAQRFQADCIKIPTRSDFTIDIDSLLETDADVIVLVNPNAPTGIPTSPSEIERLVRLFSGLVIVDEAYIDFAHSTRTVVPLIHQYQNVIVLRTFSKAFSLCGVRVGYCFSNPQIISALDKSKNLYHVNSISQKLALAALRDKEHLESTVNIVKLNRQHLSEKLLGLGFLVFPSETNFILCSPPSNVLINTERIYQLLNQRNILVRYFDSPRLNDKLRISIGTEKEMDFLYKELNKIIKEHS